MNDTIDSINRLYNAKKLQFVAKNISQYDMTISNNMDKMKDRIDNITTYYKSEGTNEMYQKFMKLYNLTKTIIKLCIDVYYIKEDSSKMKSYTAKSDKADGYLDEFKKLLESITNGTYNPDVSYSDDTDDVGDITPFKTITRLQFANLIFGMYFNYYDSSVFNLGIINSTAIKLMLRMPAIGFLVYPTGWLDADYWSNASMDSSTWLTYFRESILNDENYISNIRKYVNNIMKKTKNILDSSAEIKISEYCVEWINNNSSILSENITDTDTSFAESLYEAIIDISDKLDENYFVNRSYLLPTLAIKGISPNEPRFVPSYFPKFDPYIEVLSATLMMVNRLITCFYYSKSDTNNDNRRYFKRITIGGGVSTSIFSTVDEWTTSDFRILASSDEDSKSFDESLISITEDNTNPSAVITSATMGKESLSYLVRSKYYTASNEKLKDLIIPHILAGKYSFSLYSNNTTYKYFMSAADYIAFDPNIDPSSAAGIIGDIRFRTLIRIQFIKNIFKCELMFPIAPYIGTNFINTWLLNRYWSGVEYNNAYPQFILEMPPDNETKISKEPTSNNYPSTFSFSTLYMAGNVVGTKTIEKNSLFKE